jgi:hypothetical protein
VRWIPAAELARYRMDRAIRIRISNYLAQGTSPVIA